MARPATKWREEVKVIVFGIMAEAEEGENPSPNEIIRHITTRCHDFYMIDDNGRWIAYDNDHVGFNINPNSMRDHICKCKALWRKKHGISSYDRAPWTRTWL
jgi:hypothetical protein